MNIRQVRDEVTKAVLARPPVGGFASQISLGWSLSSMPIPAHDKLESLERHSSEERRNCWLSEVLVRTKLYVRDGDEVERKEE